MEPLVIDTLVALVEENLGALASEAAGSEGGGVVGLGASGRGAGRATAADEAWTSTRSVGRQRPAAVGGSSIASAGLGPDPLTASVRTRVCTLAVAVTGKLGASLARSSGSKAMQAAAVGLLEQLVATLCQVRQLVLADRSPDGTTTVCL